MTRSGSTPLGRDAQATKGASSLHVRRLRRGPGRGGGLLRRFAFLPVHGTLNGGGFLQSVAAMIGDLVVQLLHARGGKLDGGHVVAAELIAGFLDRGLGGGVAVGAFAHTAL